MNSKKLVKKLLSIASSISQRQYLFKNAKISFRLGLLVSFMAFLMISGGVLAWLVLNETENELYDLFNERLKPIQNISNIQTNTLKIRSLLLESIILANDSEDTSETETQIKSIIDEINNEWEVASIDKENSDLNTLLEIYNSSRMAYARDTMFPIMAAVRNVDVDEARMIQSVSENAYEKLESAINEIADNQITEASLDIADSINKKKMYKVIGISIITGGLLLAILFSVYIIRGVTRPLARAVTLANHVANGNLSYNIKVDSEDEIGKLLLALSAMNLNLQNIVSDVHKEVESISASASNVADSSETLADKINQESITLNLTTSHMENVVTTNQNAVDSAATAHTMAESAREEAENGGVVIDKAIAAMNAISNSSGKISEITDTIDSIAFQTNLLSLNATIEAASAGEHGRGFAVVANEVRVLSQRAAAASREIKELIHTSVEQIKTGKQHVDQSGKALASIQGIILDVADIVKNINTVSEQQTAGIDSINRSIVDLYDQSKQNSSTVITTAMDSDAMKERVSSLRELMKFFELDENDNASDSQNELIALEAAEPLRLN